MTDRRGRARRWQSELRAPMTRKISELSCYIIIVVRNQNLTQGYLNLVNDWLLHQVDHSVTFIRGSNSIAGTFPWWQDLRMWAVLRSF